MPDYVEDMLAEVAALKQDFLRLAADCRKKHVMSGHRKWDGMAHAYMAAANKTQKTLSQLEKIAPES